MRIALLATDTPPALRCAGILANTYDLCGILVRTAAPKLPFATAHELDAAQAAFEGDTWFSSGTPNLVDIAPVHPVPDMTGEEAAAVLKNLNPDVVISLNAGPTGHVITDMMATRALVLHPGDPQEYRGEDTHLWAVYHGDERRLESVVQYASPEPNGGSVLVSTPLELQSGTPLAGLRRAVTDGCIIGMEKVLKFFDGGGMLSVNRLQQLGKLYTPMPAVMKDYCLAQFARRARDNG
jgi:methionyl-tRNA formyltransferase